MKNHYNDYNNSFVLICLYFFLSGTEAVTAHIDPTMDMLIALEMSKLEISCLRNENERR